MSTLHKPRTFKNTEVLWLMLEMRRNGWPLKELAFFFNCDHTSVRKQCLKYDIPAVIPLIPHPTIIFQRVLLDFDGERINQGKTYREYLKERGMQPPPRIPGYSI